jgi:hypothetical protein
MLFLIPKVPGTEWTILYPLSIGGRYFTHEVLNQFNLLSAIVLYKMAVTLPTDVYEEHPERLPSHYSSSLPKFSNNTGRFDHIQKYKFYEKSMHGPQYAEERLPYRENHTLIGRGARGSVYKSRILAFHFQTRHGAVTEVCMSP